MPIDQPPSFEARVEQVMKIPGRSLIYWKVRTFSTERVQYFYDPAEVSDVYRRLEYQGVHLDYGTEMDSKTCKDYIQVEMPEPELKAVAKKL